ncbi:MAG: peptide deformylase [Patescibacteria group bacterium]
MLLLIIAPNPILRAKNEAIKFPLSSEIIELIPEMFKAMNNLKGIGLAAPQIGHNINLMVIATAQGPQAFINPRIVKFSYINESMEEGCLSVPHVFGIVKRARSIKVEYFTDQGIKKQQSYHGLMARIYQHELDHLNGILFIDQVKNITVGQELLKKYATN